MVAALALDEGIVAAKVVKGSFNQDSFLQYLRDDVVSTTLSLSFVSSTHPSQLPVSNPYPGPRSVLVMDNARIHHSDEIDELVHSYGT